MRLPTVCWLHEHCTLPYTLPRLFPIRCDSFPLDYDAPRYLHTTTHYRAHDGLRFPITHVCDLRRCPHVRPFAAFLDALTVVHSTAHATRLLCYTGLFGPLHILHTFPAFGAFYVRTFGYLVYWPRLLPDSTHLIPLLRTLRTFRLCRWITHHALWLFGCDAYADVGYLRRYLRLYVAFFPTTTLIDASTAPLLRLFI